MLFVWPRLLGMKRLPRPAWRETLAACGLLCVVVAAWRFGGRLPAPYRVPLWGLVLVAAAGLSSRGWIRLFGPVLFYDLVRTARRPRQIIFRCLYAALLLYVLVFIGLISLEQRGGQVRDYVGAAARADAVAAFSLAAFVWFMAVQLAAVFLLTPAYTAGAVAAERERQSLDALLATDLRGHEIVLSLLVSRLANLLMVLLTGLPVLALMEFLGGLDPDLVWAGFVVTALSLFSLGCLGILQSVATRRPRTAIMRTYAWVVLYLILALVSRLLLAPELELADFPSTEDWQSPVTLENVIDGLNAGNLPWMAYRLGAAVSKGAALSAVLPPALRGYAWFHGVVGVVCLTLAVLRLRACALREEVASRPRLARPRWWRLPAWGGYWPLLWKEIVADTGGRRGAIRWLGLGALVALVLFPAVHIAYWYGGMLTPGRDWGGLREPANLWLRAGGVLIGCFMLVLVGVRAAGGVSVERARQTIDGLLTTPLELRGILFAKWLGSLLAPRWSWAVLGIVWAVGLFVGGAEPVGLAGFVGAWLVYAAFIAGLGLYFSSAAGNTQRATLGTLLSAILAFAASAILAYDLPWNWEKACGLVPPIGLALVTAIPPETPTQTPWPWAGHREIAAGLVFWGILAWGLWLFALHRFRVAVGRPKVKRLAREDASVASADLPRAGNGVAAAVPAPSEPGRPSAKKTSAWGSAEADRPRPRASLRATLRRLVPVLFALLPVALLLGWYALLSLSAERRLQKAIAEADRLDPGWRLEELEAARRVVPDKENSALRVQKVLTLMPHQWPSLEYESRFSQRDTPSPPVVPDDAWVRATTAELAAVRSAVAASRKLADMPEGRYPVTWSNDGFFTNLDHTQQTRRIANLLEMDARLRAQRGDADGALDSCRAVLNAGRSVGDEPTFISGLVRQATRLIAIRDVERVLAQGEPSEEALAGLQEALTRDEREPLLLSGTRGERALAYRLVTGLKTGKVTLGSARWLLSGGGGGQFDVLVSGSLSGQAAALLRFSNQVVEIAKLPPEQQDSRLTPLIASARTQELFVRMLVPDSARVATNFRRSQADLRAAIVMVAAERFRRQHGRWPESLDELVPRYLPRVPDDPCDGRPLRYRRTPYGAVIYSVGADGVDNGGAVEVKNNTGMPSDWGVRLWDPSGRRQPPAPEKAGPPTSGGVSP
jgi:ABC-type transport system involved in multi-copper enzyme maturation permease subunit